MSLQSTVTTPETLLDWQEALAGLSRGLRLQAYRSHQLIRVTQRIRPQPLLALLSAFGSGERLFFSRRDQSLSLLGLGHCCRLQAADEAQSGQLLEQVQHLVRESGALWFGGCSFAGANGVGQWQDFPAALFVLPLVEIREQGGEQIAALNLYAESFGQWQAKLDHIDAVLARLAVSWSGDVDDAPGVEAKLQQRRDTTRLRDWNGLVLKALDRIDQGDFQKVVLAREIELNFASAPDPFSALSAIDRGDNPGYLFAFEVGKSVFFGCSPERLFAKQGLRLATEALAGTVRRGNDAGEDARLESELIQSRKLVREHRLVAEAIHSAICPLALQLSPVSEVGVVKLQHIQHSYQKISAMLRSDVTVAQLFFSLHPTPAICGFPRTAAKAFIRDHECFQRGWYSGAVGVIGADEAELSVSIRSGLCRGDRLWLYSGVGIVRGSNPAAEWQELESKLQSLLEALGGQLPAAESIYA